MDYRTQTYSTPSEAGVLLDDLKKAGIDRLKGEEQVLATLRWTMSQASAIGDAPRLNVPELLDYARRGGPMVCNDMGLVFSEALSALGIPSRRIVLARNIFDKYDVHATVEAWVDGKWRLYDPTFNVSPVSNGEVIGAFEAREIFFHGNRNIEFRFFGDVRYPARLENYYMRYEPLFNNAFVVAREERTFLRYLPLFAFFRGDVFTYPEDKSRLSAMPIDVYRDLYFLMVIILPISLLVLIVTVFVFYRIRTSRPTRDL